MKIKIPLLLICFVLFINYIYAQCRLSGTVRNAGNNAVIQGASLLISDIKTTAVSDASGNFIIKNIPEGNYTITISFVGYASNIISIHIKGDTKKDFQLTRSITTLNNVVVTGVSSATNNLAVPFPVTVVDKKALLENSATNVIDAIAKEPGVSAITDGQSISKPVIRGLGYNRVLTVSDGVQQVDQAWFDEFGIEADPEAVQRYEILKGPASLSYGSDAIAGVVNLIAEDPLPEGQTKGDILFNYQTNNGLINNMFHAAGTKHNVSWSARVDNTMAHAYQNRYDGYVLNSQFSNFNTDETIGLHRKWGYTQLHFSYFEMKTGIVDGTRDSATGLLAQIVSYPDLNNGAPTYEIPTLQQLKSYTPLVIDQRIRHTKFVWDNSFAVGEGRIKAIFSYQQNQRQERNDPTIPNVADIFYSSNAVTYDLRYISPQKGGFSFSAGTNGVYQNSKSLGTLLLIPDYHFFEIGGFAIANEKLGKLNISGGIRYDTRKFTGLDHYVDSTTQAPALSSGPNAFHEFEGFTTSFNGVSFSLGGTYNFTNTFYAKANISRGWRSPNVAECGANGVHDGTVVYEIGDHTLQPETSFEEDVALGINSKDVSIEADVFNNIINDFIYARGLLGADGTDSINNSLNAAGLGAAPVYKYMQTKAQLYGGEFIFNLHPSQLPWLELSSSFSTVYAQLSEVPDSVKYLPFVPPTRIIADVKFHISKLSKSLKNTYVRAGIRNDFEKKEIYAQYAIYNGLNTALTPYEYAASTSATKGYTLFNAGAGTDVVSKGRTVISLYLICNNLFNTGYIDYMSRFKYLPVNYTSGRVGVFNMGRNLSIKAVVPLDF